MRPRGARSGLVLSLLVLAVLLAALPVPRSASAASAPAPPVPPGPPPAAPATVPYAVFGATILGSGPTHNQPTSITADPADGYLYVTNFGSIYLGGNTVSVVNDSTLAGVATLGVGDDPIYSVYDPADQEVYVLNFGSTANVTVLNGTRSVASLPTGADPRWGLYDPMDQDVYVTNLGNANVSIFHGHTLAGTVPVGYAPGRPAYDPRTGFVYVPNAGAGNISVINGTRLVATLGAGLNPQSAAYDASNGWIYVVNTGSNNVTVVNGTRIVANLAVGLAPYAAAYDPADGLVYVSDGGSNSVHVLSGTTALANLSVGDFPRFLDFDPATGNMYVSDWASNDLSVLNGTAVLARVGAGTNPYTVVYDPLSGNVDVPNLNSANFTVIGAPAHPTNVTATAHGLPGGTAWGFQWASTLYEVPGASVIVPSANGSYNFTAAPMTGFVATNVPGIATVAGSPLSIPIDFNATYELRFVSSGLAPGTNWTVAVSGGPAPAVNLTGAASTHAVAEPNGSYAYRPLPVPGYLGPSAGNVRVAGQAVTVDLAYTEVTYPVSVHEHGLPSGASWSVVVNNGTISGRGATISFNEPNGSYFYTVPAVGPYAPPVPSGGFVLNGSGTSVNVSFNLTSVVTFLASGLPPGASWTVEFNGTLHRTSGSSLPISAPNGTYRYVVQTSARQYAVPNASGTVTVAGRPITVYENFSSTAPNATPYELRFVASGLPTGTNWSVSITGGEVAGSTPTLSFWVANGSYDFAVDASGFRATPSSGTILVAGSHAPVPVAFTPAVLLSDVTLTPDGLAPTVPWSVTVNGSTVDGVGGASIVLRLPNGTYAFRLDGATGYRYVHAGSFTVAGGLPLGVELTFVADRYPVVFRSSGLPPHALWKVLLSGVPNASTSATLTIWAANGSYGYGAVAPPGYFPPPRGSVVVDGAAPTPIDLRFSSNGSAGPSGPANVTGPWLTAPVEVGFAGLGVILAALAAVVVTGRRRVG